MFDWFKRLFGIVQSEANAALGKLEDPVKMTEQGIKDLKKDLNASLQGLAEIKAQSIRSKKSLEGNKRAALNYENKAMLLLGKAESGEIEMAEADRLATQALDKKNQLEGMITTDEKNSKELAVHVDKMEDNVRKLRTQITHWENEAKTLKARAKTSRLSAKINKQLSRTDGNDTLARLEQMKEKVEAQEALAESYEDMAQANRSIDDEIEKALGGTGNTSLALENLKSKMKLNPASSDSISDASATASSGTNENAPLSELDKLKQKLKSTGDSES